MKLEFACNVDQGIRESNDDRCLILQTIVNGTALAGEVDSPALAAVCDGCGGYDGGGVAAETVLSVLMQPLPEVLTDPERTAQVLTAAQEALTARKEQEPALQKMCTTIAGAMFHENGTLLFHAGDSRIYRYDGYYLTRMTRDHSLVQNLVNLGQLTEEEARISPQRNVITRCLGVNCPPPEVESSPVPIGPGEIYLLCSDGLWEAVSEDQLRQILASEAPLADMADQLTALAKTQGSNDNITVCLCRRPGTICLQEDTPFLLD